MAIFQTTDNGVKINLSPDVLDTITSSTLKARDVVFGPLETPAAAPPPSTTSKPVTVSPFVIGVPAHILSYIGIALTLSTFFALALQHTTVVSRQKLMRGKEELQKMSENTENVLDQVQSKSLLNLTDKNYISQYINNLNIHIQLMVMQGRLGFKFFGLIPVGVNKESKENDATPRLSLPS